MVDSDVGLRVRFANWIRSRLLQVGITEDAAGAAIGRQPGWLRKFERGRRESRDLTLEDAARLVRLLGGDPDAVFSEIERSSPEARSSGSKREQGPRESTD